MDRLRVDVLELLCLMAPAGLSSLHRDRTWAPALDQAIAELSSGFFELHTNLVSEQRVDAGREGVDDLERVCLSLQVGLLDLQRLLLLEIGHSTPAYASPDLPAELVGVELLSCLAGALANVALAAPPSGVSPVDAGFDGGQSGRLDALVVSLLRLVDLSARFPSPGLLGGVDEALRVFLTLKRPHRPDHLWLTRVLGSTRRLARSGS